MERGHGFHQQQSFAPAPAPDGSSPSWVHVGVHVHVPISVCTQPPHDGVLRGCNFIPRAQERLAKTLKVWHTVEIIAVGANLHALWSVVMGAKLTASTLQTITRQWHAVYFELGGAFDSMHAPLVLVTAGVPTALA